jgi:hypothetical protein
VIHGDCEITKNTDPNEIDNIILILKNIKDTLVNKNKKIIK